MQQWTKEQFYTHLNSGNKGAFYLYTPLCGTCQLAGKMLDIVQKAMPEFLMGKADLNFLPEIAETFQVESVPCLLIFENKQIKEKVYAFQNVSYLYEKLKSS